MSEEIGAGENSTNHEPIDEILSFILNGTKLDDQAKSIEYIDKLTSGGIHGLEVEPQLLIEENNQVKEALQDQTLINYRCFIESHDFNHHFNHEFDAMTRKLIAFGEKLPQLNERLSSFSDEAKSISKRWRQASIMLSKYNQLLEFLEIPQMVETCVRNNHYEEALELFIYVQRLNKRHGSTLPIIENVAQESLKYKEIMISQLLRQLYETITLPSCLKTINYLRRINIFTETELRIKFLTARDEWLKGLIREVSRINPINYMKGIIEINRVNLFDIIIQYRAVFADDNTFNIPYKSRVIDHQILSLLDDDDKDFDDQLILSSWLRHKIDEFIADLEASLVKIADEKEHTACRDSLGNLIEACFYFGQTMSRIGAEIRPQLVHIFTHIIERIFADSIHNSVNRFEETLERYTLMSSAMLIECESTIGDVQSILAHKPLAILYNDFMIAFNFIRKVFIVSLAVRMRDCLNTELTRVSRAIGDYYRTEIASAKPKEVVALKNLVSVYRVVFLPEISKCLSCLCPTQVMSRVLGLSVLELNKINRSGDPSMSYSQLNMDLVECAFKDLIEISEE